MENVEAVIFDLDGTLCVREQDLEEIIEAAFDRVGEEPFYTPADVHAVDYSTLPPADSREAFYEHSIRAIARDLDEDPGLAPELAAATADVVDEITVEFREGAAETFEYVRERYDVGLITNGGTETQTAKLANLGIGEDFEACVFCAPETGIAGKPDPEPYEAALRELDCTAEVTVMVGDRHEEDVVGAHEIGMRSIWVPRGEPSDHVEPEPTHRLDSMDGVIAVL